MDKLIDKTNKIVGAAGNIIGGVQLVKSLFTNQRNEERRQDERQINMQGKLNELNAKTNKDLADYEQALKMKMWKDTNYSAQMKEADKAGLSKVAVLGAGTAGATGASVGSGGIGSGASNSAANQQAALNAELQKAQLANIAADTMKTTAEAKKIAGVDTGKTGEEERALKFNNDMNKLLEEPMREARKWEFDKLSMSGEQANAEWEAIKAIIGESAVTDSKNPMFKAQKAKLEEGVAKVENLKEEYQNKIKDGVLKVDDHELKQIEKEIKSFTADLSEYGLNGTTAGLITSIIGSMLGVRIKPKPVSMKTTKTTTDMRNNKSWKETTVSKPIKIKK